MSTTQMAGMHLVVEDLAKRFGDGPAAVASLSLQVAPGELLGLLGPSGCGKTTTLRMIAGLTPASAGRIVVAGRDVTALPSHKRDMGIVFQNYALFPHMDVAGNVAFGLEMRGLSRGEVTARVARALDLVRLGALAQRRPRELSGGQQQRVALARALVIEPSILLLDEPLSNLDAKLREEMRTEIRDIQRRLGMTTVFVTHDQTEALAMCDRIAVMRAGLLEQLGTPFEIYEQPRTPFVADFVGRTNRLEAVCAADGLIALGALRVRARASVAVGPVTVMVRPHRIEIATQPRGADWNGCAGRIRRVTYVGDMLSCEVEAEGAVLAVEQPTLPGLPTPREGDDVTLAWRVADTLVFPGVAA
ncbi:ABC transporter ATP-binding protein [Limobrevibacterium gyesilva]|uniref:ABC transporter ATP-binding protein n=1 Tax=Limobrevibacterium gyesilva TaxID=2991712 RepID=A0AA42CDH8_9PROT|nr:ABC transporter ATP-binding protein [Limobrevibacterium gyesilva]MCW3473884.1 ABC transporter ATP-binding protein [Limobrevibacterium gyesilva]